MDYNNTTLAAILVIRVLVANWMTTVSEGCQCVCIHSDELVSLTSESGTCCVISTIERVNRI